MTSSERDDVPASHPGGTEKSMEELKKEKRSLIKNVLVVSVAFALLFTSYNSMENMQSSLNSDSGTTSLAALYVGFLLSGCFLPSLMMKFLKEKYTLVLCSFSYSMYMASQFYPKIYLLVPTAVVLGLGAACVWAAKGTYITKAGERYADITGEDPKTVITRFFSIFYMFYQSTQVWGNLISSAVLSVDADNNFNNSKEDFLHCGYNFCIGDSASDNESDFANVTTNEEIDSSKRQKPPEWQIYTLATFYLAGPILAGMVVLIFLDPIEKFGEKTDNQLKEKKSCKQLLAATLNHLRHPYQLLLVPLTIWSGVERAFWGADFTAAYVSCGLGIHMVGYIMICYGGCDVLGSMSSSTLVKVFGRVPVVTFAFLVNVAVIATLKYWTPNPDDIVWFFVIAGLWGIADAIWQTQINSLYGLLFHGHTEAAFSNCRLWEATGFTIAFATSSFLCISAKMIIILTFLVLGVSGYYIIELLERLKGLPKDDSGLVIPIDRLILRKVIQIE